MQKIKHEPLHEKLMNAKQHNQDLIEANKVKADELQSLFNTVFGDDKGQLVLTHLVEAYLTRSVNGNMTPNQIMFFEGQNSVVKEILTIMKGKR